MDKRTLPPRLISSCHLINGQNNSSTICVVTLYQHFLLLFLTDYLRIETSSTFNNFNIWKQIHHPETPVAMYRQVLIYLAFRKCEHITQNYWVFTLCPSSDMLRNNKKQRFGNWMCFHPQVRGREHLIS
jgi:hypothetical protein